MNTNSKDMVRMRKSWPQGRGLEPVPVARLYCGPEIATPVERPVVAFHFLALNRTNPDA